MKETPESNCVSHHDACSCREEYFKKLEIDLAHLQREYEDLELKKASCCVMHEEALRSIKDIIDHVFWAERLKKTVLKKDREN
jgi:hypothetical protein